MQPCSYTRAGSKALLCRWPFGVEKASEFPVQVVLDDTQAMMPEMKLSQAGEVMVLARISESGQAERQSGDLIGEIGPVTVAPNVAIQLTIDQRIP